MRRSTREDHPPHRWLVDFHDGVLSPRRTAQVSAYLARGCTTCSAVIEDLRVTQTAIAAGPLEMPPTAELEHAATLLRPPPRSRNVARAQLIADVSFDLVGSTRSATGDGRRLLWSIGEYEIDVSLSRHALGADLLGQVLGPGDGPGDGRVRVKGNVSMFSRGVKLGTEELSPDGRFTFRQLAAGAYTFLGRVDMQRFALPTVVVH